MSQCHCCGEAAGQNRDCPICSRQMIGHAPGVVEEATSAEEETRDLEARIWAEARSSTLQFLDGIFAVIQDFRGAKGFAVDCACLAMGRTHLLGAHNTQVLLAKKWNCSKENVRKLVDKFQELNGIMPMPGQRAEAGRENMSRQRKGQLKKT